MISSDKAVNPTSVMGVTKRVCELIVSAAPGAREGRFTKCVSVRFGNVLGSNGSMVPIFQSQIAAGGPVCVTHPEIQRYFMTSPEAVSLVLQASTMGTASELFVLDMGGPIRILDLRPGEKLFEEINTASARFPPITTRSRSFSRRRRIGTRSRRGWVNCEPCSPGADQRFW